MAAVDPSSAETVESLGERIHALVAQRQALRAGAADAAALEANRLELARLQQRFSQKLVERHSRPS